MTVQTEPHAFDDATAGDQGRIEKGEIRQFISLKVGNENYAIDILAVREIKGWTSTTVLPHQANYVLGVLNLRGAIVPVFDLRCRFGQGLTDTTPMHVITIVRVLERTVGILVDAVSDILTINTADIRPVPEMDRTASTEYFAGIVSINDITVVILNLEKLFNHSDLQAAA
jgi:purine-binding chemotaxis protein CheW